MVLLRLVLDPSGPYGISLNAWWAFITVVLFGGVLPLMWRRAWSYLEKGRWRRLRAHFGVMLSWNHGELGRRLRAHDPIHALSDSQRIFEKIQNEVGLYSSLIVSDGRLANCVGNYIGAIDQLWWALDKDYSRNIPSKWSEGSFPAMLETANEAYERAVGLLAPDPRFRQPPWEKWWNQ